MCKNNIKGTLARTDGNNWRRATTLIRHTCWDDIMLYYCMLCGCLPELKYTRPNSLYCVKYIIRGHTLKAFISAPIICVALIFDALIFADFAHSCKSQCSKKNLKPSICKNSCHKIFSFFQNSILTSYTEGRFGKNLKSRHLNIIDKRL